MKMNSIENLKQIFSKNPTVRAQVKSNSDFGVLVLLPDEIVGVIHYKDNKVGNESKKSLITLKEGDDIDVQLSEISESSHRVSLVPFPNIFSAIQNFAKKHNTGQSLKGTVNSIKQGKILIELENNVIGELRYWNRNSGRENGASAMFKTGDNISVRIEHIDTVNDQVLLSYAPKRSGDPVSVQIDPNSPVEPGPPSRSNSASRKLS